ncbi:MAG: PAS domain-containing protein [Bacteroidetes bacterium]|nr:PAS domain-containing protein [Bacteroidota bacterium]
MKVISEFIKPTRAFYDTVHDGILLSNLSGQICYANQSACKLLATPENEIVIKKNISDIFHNAGDFTEVMLKIAIHQSLVSDKVCKTKTGEARLLTLCFSLLNIPQSDPIGLQITLRNPETSPDNAPEYFKKHSSMLHALNFQQREVVFISDLRKKNNVFCSQSLENILGWSTKEFLEGGWGFVMSITHPDDTEIVVNTFIEALELRTKEKFVHDQTPIIYEYRKRHKNGSWRWVHCECMILERDAKKDILYLITFMKDVTAEKTGIQKQSTTNLNTLIESQFSKNNSSTAPKELLNVHLSAREKEILKLVKAGLSTKEISDILLIGIASVNTYRKNLMKKMNAKNTAELVQKSFDLELE